MWAFLPWKVRFFYAGTILPSYICTCTPACGGSKWTENMSGDEKEKVCCCAMNAIFGYEPGISHAVVAALGSASALFSLDADGLDTVFGPYSGYRRKISPGALDDAADELARLSADGYGFIGCTDRNYPHLLNECPDAPAGLYFRSALLPEQVFAGKDMISVVGTRDMTPYGREWTEKIVSAIASAESRPAVVSGLAYGIDVTAHCRALDSGLLTLAVMATGIDIVYPRRHREVADRISSLGALVTDFPPGTSPVKANFLRRNRIIAGLSRSTVLVESRTRGGGMMTASLAFSYGRDVYALPGRADDDMSLGCNWLVRTGKAEPIFSPEDFVARAGLGRMKKAAVQPDVSLVGGRCSSASGDTALRAMSSILSVVRRNRGITLDDLASASGLSWSETREYVARLECDGLLSVDILQRCSIGNG